MDDDFRNQKLVKLLEFEECDDIADLAEALSPDSVSPTRAGQSSLGKSYRAPPGNTTSSH
jgi:hypothetical protein